MSTLASSVPALNAPTIPRLHRQRPLVCTVQPRPRGDAEMMLVPCESPQVLPIFHGNLRDFCRDDCCADERGVAGVSER